MRRLSPSFVCAPCRAALNGTELFGTGQRFGYIGVREAMIKAFMRFYSIKYYYHEVDASFNSAVRAEAPETTNATVALSASRGAYSECNRLEIICVLVVCCSGAAFVSLLSTSEHQVAQLDLFWMVFNRII